MMTPQAQLDTFIAKYTPEIGALAKAALNKMRARLPGALELVYDNYNALVIGFASTASASDAIFSGSLKQMGANGRRRLIIKSISAKQRPRRPQLTSR